MGCSRELQQRDEAEAEAAAPETTAGAGDAGEEETDLSAIMGSKLEASPPQRSVPRWMPLAIRTAKGKMSEL